MSEQTLAWLVAVCMTLFVGAQWAYSKFLEGALKRGWDRETGYCEIIDKYRDMLREDRDQKP